VSLSTPSTKIMFKLALTMSATMAMGLEHEGFLSWKQAHEKTYESEAMHAYRQHVWEMNLELVEQHNAEFNKGRESYTLEMNKYADLTAAEFGAMMSRPKVKRSAASARAVHVRSNTTTPDEMDWRTVKNVVTAVKDQGSCGSCWAFSAVAAMEGAYNYKSGSLNSFSEQELVDCTKKGSYSCARGGEMSDGIEEIVKDHSGKINTEQQYPYTAKSHIRYDCEAKDSEAIETGITGFVAIPQGDEDALKDASATKTIISVAIDASSEKFQLYSKGVYAPGSCSSSNLDHGVAVVGYGALDNNDYWIVKNSWGESWGMDGYVLMSRNDNNKCGIATDAVYADFS